MAARRTNRHIDAKLFVSPEAASVHLSNILRKLGVSSRAEAPAVAQRPGMTCAAKSEGPLPMADRHP